MGIEAKLTSRLDTIIDRTKRLLTDKPIISTGLSPELFAECKALIFAGRSICMKIFDGRQTAYAPALNAIDLNEGSMFQHSVDENYPRMLSFLRILEEIRSEITEGILSTVAAQAQATIFDDFIDHANSYLKENRKNEAGVIAGVTFEDSTRRLATKVGLEEKDRDLDQIISDLVRMGVLSSLEGKRARVGAHVRTKATHAQWSEFDEDAVRELILFVRNNLLEKLSS